MRSRLKTGIVVGLLAAVGGAYADGGPGDSCGSSYVLQCREDVRPAPADPIAASNAQAKSRLDERRTSPSSHPDDGDSVVITAERPPDEQRWQQFDDQVADAAVRDCATAGQSAGLLAIPWVAIQAIKGACR